MLSDENYEVLSEHLKNRTKGLELVSEIRVSDTVVQVHKDAEADYYVTAGFMIGVSPESSYDAHGVTADQAFNAISERLRDC